MIGNMMPSFGILVLASLLVFTGAGPVNKSKGQSTCAVQCSDSNKFNYQPGTVYEFSYDAQTITKMNGASEDSAKIHMKAKVEIEPLTKCELVMRIKGASLRDSEDQDSQAFKEAMMKQPLKFSFQDGRIDHICAMDGESTWTLNIKRGILSAFQNSMDNFEGNQNLTETDVVGSCDSEYKILEQSKRTMLVEKTKNLFGCSDREGYHVAVQSIGYNVPPFVKSLPLLKSEYRCTQRMDLGSKTLRISECSDEHVFRPFSNGKNGALTRSRQTLTLISKKNAAAASNEHFNQRSSLKFHHHHDTQSKQEKEEKIEAKLQEICVKITESIRPEVPEMVNELIEHMRQVDQNALARVHMKINQKTICAHKVDRIMEYFHDAIPMVGTAASVGLIQDLISKKHVIGSEAEMWILSLSFVHHPTKEMVAAATPLLDEPDVSGNTLLSVSTLASSHCNMRPDCGKDSEISTLIKKLMAHTHDCNSQNADARKIILALRALGNIGHSHEAVSHLSRCATRQDVHAEIRIVAMDAFRRIPCEAARSDLMRVFRDESEDSELRLNAYIALMKCPSREVLSEVRQVLEKEKSNQVGSFVWSHLTNQMETSDSHKQELRNIVQDEELKKEFNINQKKFSRNYEGSFFLDSINTGAKVDSNVIFSDKSFIPRSANLNLTIDLFGRAINFLEVGGRVQGVETIMQNFFGQTGEKNAKNTKDVDSNMDAFRASAYMRVFGNELRYWDDKSLNELQSSLRKLMDMQVLSFSKTMQLLDSRVIIPTCVGLPLSLTMSATGSISLDANASLKKQKFQILVDMKPSASVQVKGEMTVDAHVTKAGLKMVTVAHTSTGLTLDIHNNKFDLQVPKKMEIFNLKTDFFIVHRNTQKKQKMLVGNMKKHEICTGRSMTQLTGLTFCQNVEYPMSSGDKNTPFPLFAGPIVYDLYMINEDAPNGYQIEGFTNESPYSMYMDTPNSKVSRRFAFDTVMKNKNEAHITIMAPWKKFKFEGVIMNHAEHMKLAGALSLNDRKEFTLSAELGMKHAKGLWSFTPKFEVAVPHKKMTCEGKIEVRSMKTLLIDVSAMGFTANDINLKVSGEIVPKEIGLTTQLKIGKKEYYIASRMGRMETKTGFKYSPFLKITLPKRDLVELTSEILYESNKKMSFDIKLDKVFSKTVAMNGLLLLNAGKTKTKHILKVTFKSPSGGFRINGDVENEKNGLTSRINANYDFGPKHSDQISLSSKIRDLSVKNSERYIGNIALASKEHEFLNFNLKGQFAKAVNHLETKFDVQYGNAKIKTNNLKFDLVLNRALKEYSHTYDYTMTIQHPGQKIDYRMEVHHLQSASWPFKKFENTMKVQSASKDVLKTDISYINGKEKGLQYYKAEVSTSYRGKDIKISDKLIQLSNNNYANNFEVHWKKDGLVSIDSSYNKTRTGLYHTSTTIRLSGEKEIAFRGMMHVTPKDYEATVSLKADPGLMSHERINFKAKAGVQHKLKAAQMSTDASLDVAWAEDKKVSGSFNLGYKHGVSLNSQLVIHTSFDVMKDFNIKIKGDWEKNKLTAEATSSLNNNVHIKQNIFYAHPNHKLVYNSHVDYLGKKSDIVIDLIQKDSSFNGTMKISKDKEVLIDITASYTGHRATVENDIKLNFKVFAATGEMHMDTKYDSKKHILASNGLARFNLPLKELRQISGSYNLKHNNGLSSLDMTYSSSLKNYRNGKMSVEIKRNLPILLKATMDLEVNDSPMFNVLALYKMANDVVDVKFDMKESNVQKITVSGNINYSGSKKTGTVEIKSEYIDFSADGAFEYQGIRSASGELKMKADGKSMMVEAHYKKEGTAYKVNGHLVLPDGRSLKIEGSLDLQNIAASLKTMSPEFPELTEVDMAFTFSGDKRMFNSAASLKVMPYFDTSKVEMKLTKKVFSIELDTKHGSIKQAKVAVSFEGDWVRSHKVKTILQLNNENMFDMNTHYNFKSASNFVITMAAVTSHKHHKEFLFDLKNKGPLSGMQSSLKLKVSDLLNLNAMFDNSKKATKGSFDAKLLDFDEVKMTLALKGNLDSMNAKIITSIAKKEVNRIEFTLKEHGRMLNAKVTGPKAFNFDFDMKLDTEKITFDLASTFTMDGREKYEMSMSYEHLSKLIIKTSIPSYNNELSIMFSGSLKAFTMSSKFTHNNQIYKLDLSNKQYYRQLKAILNTPHFKDVATFKFDGKPNEMNIFAQVMHNKEKFELTFSNSGYYEKIDVKLDTPYFKPTLTFSLIGHLEKFNFGLEIHFDKEKYEMKASNEDYFKKMNFLLKTPFVNCDFMFAKVTDSAKGAITVVYDNTNYDASFEIIGNLNDMQATLLYKLGGKEQFKSQILIKGHGATINAMVKIPVILDFDFESKWDMEKLSLNLHSSMELKQKEIYKIAATYEHMKEFNLKTSVMSYNGELVITLGGNRKTLNASLKMMPYFDTIHIEMKLTKKMIGIEIKTPFDSVKQAKASVTFEGDWVRSHKSKTVLQLNNKEMFELDFDFSFKSAYDFAIGMTAITAHKHHKEFEFDLKNKGGMQSSLKLKVSDLLMFDAMLENSKKATKGSFDAKLLDFDEFKMAFTLKGNLDSMNAKITTSIAKKEANRIEFTLKEHGRMINAKVAGPKAFNFDFDMKLDTEKITFDLASTFTMDGREKYEMSMSYEHLSKLIIKTSIPSYNNELSIMFSGSLKAFTMSSKFTHNNQIYKLDLSNKQYYRQLKAILNTPHFKDVATFKFDGKPNEMNIFAQVMHNKEKFELTFSNSGYYEKIDVKLDTPYFKPTLTFSLMGDQKKFNLELKISIEKDIYEMKASNEGYFRQLNFLLDTPQLDCNFEFIKSGKSFKLKSMLKFQAEEIYNIVATYEHFVKLNIKVSIPSYNDELTMTLNGDLKMFNAAVKFMHNSKKYELIVSNKDYYHEMNAQLVTPFFKEMASFVFSGDEKAFTARAKFMHDDDLYEMAVSNRKHFHQMTITLSTPFFNDKLDIDFEGKLSSFKTLVTFSHNEDKYELEVSNEGFYRKMNAKLTTPSIKTEAMFALKGSLKTFSSMAELTYNEKKCTLEVSNKDYYKQMSIKLLTPVSDNSLTFSLEGELDSFNAKLNFMHFKDVYEMVLQNSGYYRDIKANLDTPHHKCSAEFSLKGKLQSFQMSAKVMHNEKKFQLTLSTVNYYREIKTELITPFFGGSAEFSLKGKLQSFDMLMKVMHDDANASINKGKYELKVSTKNYFREVTAMLTTPQLGKQSLMMKITGQLKNFTGFIELKNNEDVYKSEFTLKNNRFRLSLPKWIEKLNVKLVGDWKNFQFSAQLMTYSGQKYEISAINKNLHDIKAHLHIPQLDKIDVSIKTNGNLKNGGATMKLTFGEHIFESDAKINFDGTKANVEINPHYKIFGRSGKARLQIDLMFEAQSYKYEFEANAEGTEVKSTATVKLDPEINIMMTIDIPTLDASEMKLRIVSKGFEKTNMILNMKSPWTGTMKIIYEHDGKKGKTFGSSGYVEQDGVRLAGYSLNTDFSGDYSFHIKFDYDNSKHVFETRGNLKFQGGKTVVTLGTKTPFRFFKDVSATVEHKMQKDETNVKLVFSVPNQEYHLDIDLSDSTFNALLDLNMDKKNNDKHFKSMLTFTNSDRHVLNFNFKMILLERTVSLDSHIEDSKDSIDMSGHFMWGKDKKIGFELMAQKGKEGTLRIITPSRTIEIFGKFGMKGNHYFTEGHIIMDEKHRDKKIDLKADVTIFKDKAEMEFTIRFPNQKKGMNLKTIIHSQKDDVIFGLASEFSMDQDPKKTFKMSTKLMSETKGKRDIYTIHTLARHAHSALSADLIGRLTSTPEKYHADVEMGYLTPKRQQKMFAIRGEMHRQNHEAILKFESPSKAIKWNAELLKDINLFRNQKLVVFRKELETFGDHLGKMLDDEISKKLHLVMRTFSEDLAPVRDYFL